MIHDNKVRVQVVGRKELLPDRVLDAIKKAEDATSSTAISYSQYVLHMAEERKLLTPSKKSLRPMLLGRLNSIQSTHQQSLIDCISADLPDPDLVIRTSGEGKGSNFLLWQIAYSELYFSDVHWPSFGRRDLYEAIEDYQMRKRRYRS